MESFEIIKKIIDETFGIEFKVIDVTEDKILKEEKKLFTKMINKVEKLIINEDKIYEATKIDTSSIVEPYWTVISDIFSFTFSDDVADLIWWYLHNRKASDGKILPWEDDDGVEYKFENPGDLYEYIIFKFDL